MEENDPHRLARELERKADELEEHSDSLAHEISDVRQDWQRKRADAGTPGALPLDGEEEGAGAAEPPGDA